MYLGLYSEESRLLDYNVGSFTRHSIPAWNSYKLQKTGDVTTDITAASHISQNPRVNSVTKLTVDAKHSTCAGNIPYSGSFDLSFSNYICSGFRYAGDDLGVAEFAYYFIPYRVEILDHNNNVVATQDGVYETIQNERAVVPYEGSMPPETIFHKDFNKKIDFSGSIDAGRYTSNYTGNLKARVTVLPIKQSDYYETLYQGYLGKPCYGGTLKCGSNCTGQTATFSVFVPKAWNTYNLKSQSVSALNHINSVTGSVSDIKASFVHPDVSCDVRKMAMPVEFTVNWDNIAGLMFDCGGSDKGEASLAFKKFKYRYAVQLFNQSGVPYSTIYQETNYDRHAVCSDTSLPAVGGAGDVMSKSFHMTLRDTLDVDISSLKANSNYDIRVSVSVLPEEWEEKTVCFARQYDNYSFKTQSMYSASKGISFKRWCDTKWYDLPCVDGSGSTASQKTALNIIRDNLYFHSDDIPEDGYIDESVDSLRFDVGFRLSWNNLAAKSAYFDYTVGSEATARYAFNRFRYNIQILLKKDGRYYDFKDLCPDGEYVVSNCKYPSYSKGGTFNTLACESDMINVSGKIYIGDVVTNYSIDVAVKITVSANGFEEVITGEWQKDKLGLVNVSPWLEFSGDQRSFTRKVKPLALSTDALQGRENRYWIYNHPDAELSLRLGKDGLRKDSYAAFFAGYGPLASAFPGDDEPYRDECGEMTRIQSLNGTLLPGGYCSQSAASQACNKAQFEYFGDIYGTGCPYYCIDYGSSALYNFFVSNYAKKGEFSPGETYLRRFARPRNLLLRTKYLNGYNDADFYEDNIFKIDNIEGEYAVDRLYHLRDFEFVVPAGETSNYHSNIRQGDEFVVSARRFMKSENANTPIYGTPEKPLFFCGVTPSMKWDADYPDDRSVFDEGDWSARYFSTSNSPLSIRDIYPENDLRFLVVPALKFDPLTAAEKDSLYHCANAVYDVKALMEDDVIHLYAKELSLDTPDGKSVVSRSDYGVQRYWEYSTEPAGGKWKRADNDEQLRQFFIDSKDLPWVPEKMKNDSDLWINSAVLLEQGVKTRKVLHFRQAAAVTRFTSDSESELYSHRMDDGRYCVKVVSGDYYTIVAIPNINKDNLRYVSGGDDIHVCWGDTIPSGQDSVVYTLQKGGDIATDRELVRLLDNNVLFRAERVTRKGVSDITSGIEIRDREAHVRLQYYQPPREKAPEDGDTITYRFYVSSCRNVIMDSIRIITYPHDRLSIDSLVVEDGYIASKDAFGDTILVRAEKGTSPKLLVKGADISNYKYTWHKRTTIDDYPGMMPLPYAQYVPYWSDEQLTDLTRTIGLECDSNSLNKYYNLYYEIYSVDPTHPEFGGFVIRTNFDSPYVTIAQRRAYCYFIINEVNACRADKAKIQYEMDNSWTGFTSQGSDKGDLPWVRLTPHERYLQMDENFFFIRREGRYGSPCGQDCPSDSIKVTVRYYSALSDNVISYQGADSIVVLYNEKVDRIDGTPTAGGYGDPASCPDIVSRRYMWEMTADTLSGVWTRIQNIDGMGNDFLQQPYGETADKYCNLPEGVLTSKGGQVFLRRVVWSILDSDLDSRIESVSNVFRIVSARLLDEGDLVHNSKAGQKDISLCPDASDFIVVCEPEENIDHNSRYVWDLRYDDGTEVPHTEFSDNHDYVRHRDNPQYPELNNAVTVDNVSEDYTASVFRIDAVTGMFSDTVVSRVHVWRMEPDFLYATSADDFNTWHTTDNPLLTVSAGTLTRLRATGVVEDEDESLRLWTLQVQDFVDGQDVMGYQSQQSSPYLYLYNPGENRMALHVENMHGCKADAGGSVYVDGVYSGERRSAFVSDDDDLYSWGAPSDLKGTMVSLYPTVIARGGEVFVSSGEEFYDITVTDSLGRVVLVMRGLSGDASFRLDADRGVYNAAVGSHLFRIFVN